MYMWGLKPVPWMIKTPSITVSNMVSPKPIRKPSQPMEEYAIQPAVCIL